ncbi:MAG: chorismate mutase [Gemmatimonas sp.]|jgi:chorismate mutase|uniref:chorismate mutase n=1 Tax=Gemmatimonas sp. TaxID=1962908 RepID=UPI00391F883C|nr:chorismate mutase [Gemmatimonadota bacterium]
MSPADAVALEALRREIEAVDAVIIDALAQRMALAREIRVVKQRARGQHQETIYPSSADSCTR